jgi:hypothetical protein
VRVSITSGLEGGESVLLGIRPGETADTGAEDGEAPAVHAGL